MPVPIPWTPARSCNEVAWPVALKASICTALGALKHPSHVTKRALLARKARSWPLAGRIQLTAVIDGNRLKTALPGLRSSKDIRPE